MSVLDPNKITKYISKLNRVEKLDKCRYGCNDYYTVEINEVDHKFHPDIPVTKIWTYGNNGIPKLIDSNRFTKVNVKWSNNLPEKHLLEEYIDNTLEGVQHGTPDVRNAFHLHGGEQPPDDDGNSFAWITPQQHLNYVYPNRQHPTMLFWHDHAIGITRLNIYAGLTGGIFIIRDAKIEHPLNLPYGEFEIPLVISDKIFGTDGSLIYSTRPSSPLHPKWRSTFFGNTIIVNGTAWPYLKVKKSKYRFRILNGSDSRFYTFKLVRADDINLKGPAFMQIGSDGGYLPKPLELENISIGPTERVDVIIDFSDTVSGIEYILMNTSTPLDNNTNQIMKFIVQNKEVDEKFSISTPDNFTYLDEKQVSVKREITISIGRVGNSLKALYLNNSTMMMPVTERPLVGSTEIWEFVNLMGGIHPIHVHLIQFQLLDRQKYDVVAYQNALNIANPHMEAGMGIMHPISVKPFLIGNAVKPTNTNEDSWKDTIKALGSQVTRILVRFGPQTDGWEFPFDPTKGSYAYHCHIISHEDNEMMRPFQLYYGNSTEPIIPIDHGHDMEPITPVDGGGHDHEHYKNDFHQ